MSRVLGVVVRLFVVWQLSLVLAALLCSSLPTTTKTPIAAAKPTITTKSSSQGTAGGDGSVSKTDESNDEDRLKELWLDDFDVELGQAEEDDAMLSDYPQMLGDEAGVVAAKETEDEAPTCPPPPRSLPTFACSVDQCESDKNCSSGTLCCYNGCRYTCMTPVQPPPYIDWKRQPQSRLVAGSSWLVPGPDEDEEVEWCSTSAEMFGADEDPLLCPHGYVCHVEDPGDPDNATPNIGRCIQQFTVEKRRDASEDDCQIGQKRYANGSSFEYNQHNCFCENGSVLCRVGRIDLKNKTKSRTRTRN